MQPLHSQPAKTKTCHLSALTTSLWLVLSLVLIAIALILASGDIHSTLGVHFFHPDYANFQQGLMAMCGAITTLLICFVIAFEVGNFYGKKTKIQDLKDTYRQSLKPNIEKLKREHRALGQSLERHFLASEDHSATLQIGYRELARYIYHNDHCIEQLQNIEPDLFHEPDQRPQSVPVLFNATNGAVQLNE